jgi:hypothetical protein
LRGRSGWWCVVSHYRRMRKGCFELELNGSQKKKKRNGSSCGETESKLRYRPCVYTERKA